MKKFFLFVSLFLAHTFAAAFTNPILEFMSAEVPELVAFGEELDMPVTVIRKADYTGNHALVKATRALGVSIYENGTCTLVVDTRQLSTPLSSKVAREVDVDDVRRMLIAHEFGHCIAGHRQAREMAKLRQGESLDDAVFLNPGIFKLVAKGELTQATFNALLSGVKNKQREENFADSFALLYICKRTPAICESMYSVMRQERVDHADKDPGHDTVTALDLTMDRNIKYPDSMVLKAHAVMVKSSDT